MRPRDRIVLPEGRRSELERGNIIVEKLPSAEGVPGVVVHGVLRCSPDRVWDLLIDYRSLSEAIFGLSSAEVVEGAPGDAVVRFTMKLPFPFGAITWINRVRAVEREGLFVVSWDYLEGDLETNEGWLAMTQHGGRVPESLVRTDDPDDFGSRSRRRDGSPRRSRAHRASPPSKDHRSPPAIRGPRRNAPRPRRA